MIKSNQYLKTHQRLTTILDYILSFYTYYFYVIFAIQVITCFMISSLPTALLFTGLNGLFFTILTIVRKKINAPRPYEVLQVQSVKPKSTKGQSFPSRHTFSATMISGNWIILLGLTLDKVIGIPLFIFSLIGLIYIMIIRVLFTFHFPKDILAGLISGIIATLLMFIILL